MDSVDELGCHFETFARRECDGAPLYRYLSLNIAQDRALLDLAAHGEVGPKPNLFLATVHYLLLAGAKHPLAGFYPTLTADAEAPDEAFDHFQDFCLAHPGEVINLMKTRLVQTNEVRRAAILIPALHHISAREPDRPLTLIEVGTSAGLLLQLNRYGYDYGTYGVSGDQSASLVITCAVRGEHPPPLPPGQLAIRERVGIDLHPMDVSISDEALWLQALVWPDHLERFQRLQRALDITRDNPPQLVAGDAINILPQVLTEIELGSVPCIFHCHVLNQFPTEARHAFNAILREGSVSRALYRVSLEAVYDDAPPRLIMTRYEGGCVASEEHLANYQSHGEWIEWLSKT